MLYFYALHACLRGMHCITETELSCECTYIYIGKRVVREYNMKDKSDQAKEFQIDEKPSDFLIVHVFCHVNVCLVHGMHYYKF